MYNVCTLCVWVCECVCVVWKNRLTVCSTQPVLRVDYISRSLAAAQHGTITMEGDNLIVLNGGFRVNAPPAGSCQVLISHYGRWRTQRNPTTTPVRTGGTPEGKHTDDFLSLSLSLSHTHSLFLWLSHTDGQTHTDMHPPTCTVQTPNYFLHLDHLKGSLLLLYKWFPRLLPLFWI